MLLTHTHTHAMGIFMELPTKSVSMLKYFRLIQILVQILSIDEIKRGNIQEK